MKEIEKLKTEVAIQTEYAKIYRSGMEKCKQLWLLNCGFLVLLAMFLLIKWWVK